MLGGMAYVPCIHHSTAVYWKCHTSNVYPMSTNVYLMSFYVGVLPGPPLR